jgi:hypothetical protein
VPVSDMQNIPAVMNEIYRLQPVGIIELGIGVGKWATLCRELLDGTYGRVKPKDWRARIVGVEGFKEYENPAWAMYDKVVIADFVDYYESVMGWPVVLMIDSLEHVEATTGQAILRYLVEHNENVIVSVPLGECPQNAVFGNEYERHRTSFDGSEFRQYKYTVLYKGVCLVVSIHGVRERINGVRE